MNCSSCSRYFIKVSLKYLFSFVEFISHVVTNQPFSPQNNQQTLKYKTRQVFNRNSHQQVIMRIVSHKLTHTHTASSLLFDIIKTTFGCIFEILSPCVVESASSKHEFMRNLKLIILERLKYLHVVRYFAKQQQPRFMPHQMRDETSLIKVNKSFLINFLYVNGMFFEVL